MLRSQTCIYIHISYIPIPYVPPLKLNINRYVVWIFTLLTHTLSIILLIKCTRSYSTHTSTENSIWLKISAAPVKVWMYIPKCISYSQSDPKWHVSCLNTPLSEWRMAKEQDFIAILYITAWMSKIGNLHPPDWIYKALGKSHATTDLMQWQKKKAILSWMFWPWHKRAETQQCSSTWEGYYEAWWW